MFKNYAIGTTLLAMMLSLGTSAQSLKTRSELQIHSQVSFTSKSGTANYQGNARGGQAPPNDLCTGAVAQNLATGSTVTFTGDNTGANLLEDTDFFVVWESFTTTSCANITLNYCVSGFVFEDFLINITNTCPDIFGGLLTGAYTDCEVSFANVQAGTWYIPVLVDPEFTPVGSYSISVSATACGGGGTTPPNDLCTGAVPQDLEVGSTITFTGDNTGATNTEGFDFSSVWESFTTTECSNLTLSYCGTSPVFDNAFLRLFVGCPSTGSLQSSSFDQTTCADGSVTIFYEFVPAGTYYYAVLTDVGSVGPYNITVSAVACPAGYCNAAAGDASFETIGNVLFAGINNPSTAAVGYENFTTIVGTAAQGSSQSITVTIAGGYPEDQVLVWIDFDQSESFEAGELVYTSAVSAGPHTGTINIPANATLGNTRMRIRLQDSTIGPNNTACGNNSYGQVEDYTINIISGGPACDADAGTLSGGGIVCFENGAATLVATANGNAVVPAGFITGYALTEGAGLVIINASSTPEFTVDALGVYTIHTLVYDATTLDLGALELGVTTGFDVNGLLIQGGGTICASLDVSGAAFIVEICSSVQDRAGFDMAVFPNPSNGDFAIRSAVNGAVTVELLDLSGRLVYSDQHVAVANEVMQVQLGGRLAAGTYMLRMANADGNSTVRVTVK